MEDATIRKICNSIFINSISILLMGLASARAQVWEEWVNTFTMPGCSINECEAITIGGQGDVYVAGRCWGADYYLVTVKYNSTGVQRWTAIYPAIGFVGAIAVDVDENVYVTSSKSVPGGYDYLTIKYAASGEQLWATLYNGPAGGADDPNDLAVDSAGDVYVTGWSTGVGTGPDFATIKYDSSGVEQWVARYNSPNNGSDFAMNLEVDPLGNIVVIGSSYSAGQTNGLLIKYDPFGTVLWTAVNQGYVADLALDREGNVYIAGTGGTGILVALKYDAAGVLLWTATYQGPMGDGIGMALAVDHESNVYVTGYCHTSWTYLSYDYATVKFNAAGVQQWAALYGMEEHNDFAFDVAVDSAENVYVAGHTEPGGSTLNTVKYNAAGSQQWVAVRTYALGVADRILQVDGENNVYVIDGYYNYITVKYSQSPVGLSLSPLNPPVQIPASGGGFNFNIAVVNRTVTVQTVAAWIMVKLPAGIWNGPVFGPLVLSLPPSASLTRLRSQIVPASAPSGAYWYEGRIGDYPDSAWDVSGFGFTKLGFGVWGLGADKWDNTGEALGDAENTFITHNSSLMTSCSPNPFNPTTVLSFELPVAGLVKLEVFDINGRSVGAHCVRPSGSGTTPTTEMWFPAGTHQIPFDGSSLPSGIYLARITAGNWSAVQKLVLLK